MNKFYHVFISSVSRGLSKVRSRVIENILSLDKYFPLAMEYMSGREHTIEMLYAYMKSSDIYVLILGKSQGSKIGAFHAEDVGKICAQDANLNQSLKDYLDTCGLSDPQELTFTEFEYILATAMNVKKTIFVHKKCERSGASANRLFNVLKQDKNNNAYKPWNDQSKLWDDVCIAIQNIASDLTVPNWGWIRETDGEMYTSAQRVGISRIHDHGIVPPESFSPNLSNSKVLKLFYTTGARFFYKHENILADFLANGGEIRFLCMKPYSASLLDVAEIEASDENVGREAIHTQLLDCLRNAHSILNKANKAKGIQTKMGTNSQIGKISIGFASTLFRSSVLLCENEHESISNWGWLTITFPPSRSKDAVSFELIDTGEGSIWHDVNDHFNSVWNLAESRGEIFDVSTVSNVDDMFHWEGRSKQAEKLMAQRKNEKGVLIEVAANHPLVQGKNPSEEFSARLDVAKEIYLREKALGRDVYIYVPGCRHKDKGVEDECALSKAGCDYLELKGVPRSALLGENLNSRYDNVRDYAGVYNTADECCVASHYFKENKKLGRMICVCSPNQLMRKKLFYIEFGVIPDFVTVPCDNLAHNFLYEIMRAVPDVLQNDHSWQERGSKEAIRTRRERDPNWTE